MHDCPNQKMIDQLQKTVISGNGEPSLLVQVKGLTTEMRGVRDDIKEYMKRQEDLIKEFGITNREFYDFKSATEATEIEKQKQEVRDERKASRNRWIAGICVTIFLGALSYSGIWLRSEQKALESRQDWDSYDMMVMMDSLGIDFKGRSVDSLDLHF